MFGEKEIRVVLSEDAYEEYVELNKVVGEEAQRGVESSVHQSILASIKRVRDLLKTNPFAGE